MGVAGGGDSVQSTGSPGTKDDTSIYQTLSTLNLRIRFTFLHHSTDSLCRAMPSASVREQKRELV
jgi:hypothetical protein